MNNQKRVKGIISEVLDIPIQEINRALTPEVTLKWDSLGQMNLILAIEEELQIKFEIATVPIHHIYRIIASGHRVTKHTNTHACM